MAHKGFCDNCGRETQVKKLPLGTGKYHGNAILCRGCWTKEMSFRKYRNKELAKKKTGTRFSIRKFS